MKEGDLYKTRSGKPLYFSGKPYKQIKVKKVVSKMVTYTAPEIEGVEFTVATDIFNMRFEAW